jgi:hypothetical protein
MLGGITASTSARVKSPPGHTALRHDRVGMAPEPENDFQKLLELARESAQALRDAGVAPQSPVSALRGWLAIERLDFTDVTHAAGDGSGPQFETLHFEQIWLTVDGRLQNARRERAAQLGSGGERYPDSGSTRAGAVIASPDDLGARWDGAYGSTSRWIDRVERSVQDVPSGPREDSAARTAAAQRRTTAELLERRGRDVAAPGTTEPAASRARDVKGLSVSGYAAAGLAAALIVWILSDFERAFTTLLWATPLLLLAFAAATIYVGFSRFGPHGFAVIIGTAVSVVLLWVGYVVTVDLWLYDNPRACSFVERLPKGQEFCAPKDTGAEQWDPPLWHFGR